MKYIKLIVFIMILPTWLFSQKKESFNDTYKNLQNIEPYYTFNKGFGFTTPDSTYQLNLQLRMQNRVESIYDDSFNLEEQEAIVKRLRLKFYGYVYDPAFIYYVQLSFTGGDVGGQPNSNLPSNLIKDAVIYYKPGNGLSLGFGQTKLPGNRQGHNSSGKLQLVDRSMVHSKFNIDRDFGVFANYHGELGNSTYSIKTAISSGEGSNWLSSTNSGYMYTGRLEFLPFGDFTKNGGFSEGDLMREPTPKLMIGAVAYYNDDALREEGTKGDLMYNTNTITGMFFDVIFKYKGFAFMADYAQRNTENPSVIVDSDDSTNFSYTYNGIGYNTQASYWFKNNYEIVGRFTRNTPEDSIQQYQDQNTQYTVGFNKYIKGHRFKLQFDTTYQMLENLQTTNTKNNWIFRAQVEIGI